MEPTWYTYKCISNPRGLSTMYGNPEEIVKAIVVICDMFCTDY